MSSNNKSTYDSIISDMAKEDKFDYFYYKDVTNSITQDELIKLCANPKNITYKDGELFVTTVEDGEEQIEKLIDSELGVDDCGLWLSDAVVDPPFDIAQDGNIRKSIEAESAFTCCIITGILNDSLFKEEIDEVINSYNFSKMAASDQESYSFKDLLEEWQKLNSFVINVIVSACKKKISDQKKDADKFLRDGLTQEELTGLKDLQTVISSVITKYTGPKGELNPNNLRINKLKKVRILELLDNQRDEIQELVNSSKFGVLWRILNLSTEYVDPITKKKLKYEVLQKTEMYYDGSQESENTDKEIFVKKLNSRVLKVQRNSLRKSEILKYLEDKISYTLPSKQ